MTRAQDLPHVHRDPNVDLERVTKFADSSPQERLAALSELRSRVADDSNTIELALTAGFFGVLAAAVLPRSANLAINDSWWIGLIVWSVAGFVGGFILVFALSPVLLPILKRSHRRNSAEVWLRAYEQELATRWTRRDRKARQWQKKQIIQSR